MKKIPVLIFLFLLCLLKLNAQFEELKDSIVQVYGVVMSHENFYLLPNANVQILGSNRGTITNQQGVYSIVAFKGDTLRFSYVGFKPSLLIIPNDIKGNQLSAVQVLTKDTITLPVAIIKPRPTREQFERDFIAYRDVNETMFKNARTNAQSLDRAIINSMMALDDKQLQSQNYRRNLEINSNGGIVGGGLNILQVLNPSAWKTFIKDMKSEGDNTKKITK